MQLFTSILAVAASIFVMVSAEEQQHGVKPKSRDSSRASKPIIGGDSSVWTPKHHCDSSSTFASPCSSAWSSSAAYGCDLPCGIACNPLAPAVTPLKPVTACDPLYGPGYGAYPAGGCGPVGCGVAPYPAGGCVGAYGQCADPCARPCDRPCDRKSRGSRLYAEAPVGRCAPLEIYLTATVTSVYSSTSTVNLVTSTTIETVSYRIATLTYVPTIYPDIR